MKFAFGNHVFYTALNNQIYNAVVLGPHKDKQEGDYFIAYHLDGEVVLTHCWEERLGHKTSTPMQMLEHERRRGIAIAHRAMEQHSEKHEKLKQQGNRMAFVEEEIANECRLIANQINGGDDFSPIGETMSDRIQKEYATVTIEE